MQTTYKQQMEAIQKMRKVADEFYPEYSLALNDAYSTIAAVKFMEENKKVKIARKPKVESLAYGMCVEFWLKEFHEGFIFKGQQGKAMKSIIEKIRQSCKNASMEGNDMQIFLSFKKMCLSIPEYYKSKDLPILDSKYNEIIYEIKNGKRKDGFNNKNSHERFSDFAGRV
jgi:hypothetical protein